MSRLELLPCEILLIILHDVHPRDLENFAQVSKLIPYVAQPSLRAHRKLIRRYRDLYYPASLDQTDKEFEEGPVPSLLDDVLLNRRVGHYVKSIVIGTHFIVNHSAATLEARATFGSPARNSLHMFDRFQHEALNGEYANVRGWFKDAEGRYPCSLYFGNEGV